MKIIVATDSFKGSISAEKACDLIASSITEECPGADVVIKPMADGGEGTARAMIAACQGSWVKENVMGPLAGMNVEAGLAWFDKTRTALIEMACASGIMLLSEDRLNPLYTTTYGTGQLIRAAVEKKPQEILLAIGGSATVDMGIGAAIAMGWKFLDKKGRPVGLGAVELERIEDIIPPKDSFDGKIKVLSDVDNPLYGPNGAARIFGPQKGADRKMVEKLESSIKHVSGLVKDKLGIDISVMPGGGAAGGLGAGAAAFMGAEIVSGIETIVRVSNLKEQLQDADWVITGEGKFDSQSLRGKVVCGIVQSARHTPAKIAVIAGDVNLKRSEYCGFGIVDAIGLKEKDMTVDYAIQNCRALLKKACHKFAAKHLGTGIS